MNQAERPEHYTEKILFDTLFPGSKLSAEQARISYDGTVFNGMNLVQVVLSDKGKVTLLRSFSASDLKEAVPFHAADNGGWHGEGGYYGPATILGRRLNAIVESVHSEWKIWKETGAEHPGMDFRIWKSQKIKSMIEEFHDLNLQLFTGPHNNGPEAYLRETGSVRQRYHDYYVKKYISGELSDADLPHYFRAMEWEKDGLVTPYDAQS